MQPLATHLDGPLSRRRRPLSAHAAKSVGLVYIAAFTPDEGESVLDLIGRFPGSLLFPVLRPATATDAGGARGVGLCLREDTFARVLAGDLPTRVAAVLAATKRPIATDDRTIPAAAQRSVAQRAGAPTVELGASHAVALSQPGAIAALIHGAATRRPVEHGEGGAHDGPDHRRDDDDFAPAGASAPTPAGRA